VTHEKTFVLVHGGVHGGWFRYHVAKALRALGHSLFTPTQTGCGQRAHLISKSITLDTVVDDIANVFQWEDLRDVILVGHSFGGNSISGVADRIPERIRQLIYLDAMMLEGGQTMFGQMPPAVAASRLEAAQASGGVGIARPEAAYFGIVNSQQAAFVQARLTAQPLGVYTSALNLTHPLGNGLPAVYVQCTDPVLDMLKSSRDWVKTRGMTTVEIKTRHDAIVSAPARVTDLLHQLGTGVCAPN
jgi:pimeloyl-ACP methyl ester carboxylesterase